MKIHKIQKNKKGNQTARDSAKNCYSESLVASLIAYGH